MEPFWKFPCKTVEIICRIFCRDKKIPRGNNYVTILRLFHYFIKRLEDLHKGVPPEIFHSDILQTLKEIVKQSQNRIIIILPWKYFVAKKYFRLIISTMSNGNFPTVPKLTLRKPRGEPNYAQPPNL